MLRLVILPRCQMQYPNFGAFDTVHDGRGGLSEAGFSRSELEMSLSDSVLVPLTYMSQDKL